MNAPHTLKAVFVELTLAECVDNHDLVWSTGGASNWVGQVKETHDDQDAAQSGTIGDAEVSWIETTVHSEGTLTFSWKVSSEEWFDWFYFMCDDYVQLMMSGEKEWRQVTFRVEGEGSHVLKWVYSKDKSLSVGDDCGWLDQVVWTSDTPPATGFVLWLADRGISGDAAALFAADRNCDGVPNGFEYVFGENLTFGGPLLNIRMINGRPVIETPVQDAVTLPYADVRVRGTDDLTSDVWNLPVVPSSDTAGKPADRVWHEPEGAMPDKAFFRLEAELK